MSVTSRKQTAFILCLVGLLGIIVSLARIIPLGMSGHIAQAKPFMVTTVTCLVISIPAALVYQFYRNKPMTDDDLVRMRMEMDALSKAGKKQANDQKPKEEHHDSAQ